MSGTDVGSKTYKRLLVNPERRVMGDVMASVCRQRTGVGDLTEESRRNDVDDREENECV